MEQKSISSDLIRGHIDTIILHTLLSGDKCAQQISDDIEEKSQNEYKINQATLYSSLKRLESLKYTTSYWNDSSDGGRRKFFKLTDLGKNSVEENLSNWSYSRSIINRLMDCEPQPIYKTQYIEKIVEVPAPISQADLKQNPTEEQPQKNVEAKSNITKNNEVNAEIQDINFRSILQGLIKSTAPANQSVENEPITLEPLIEKQPEKPKLNQTLNEIDYNSQRSNNGKIDFGDLVIKAEKEGFKIKISSKDSQKKQGTLLINKLNLHSILFVYAIILVEMLFYVTSYGHTLGTTPLTSILTICVLSCYPIYRAVKYVKAPKQCSNKTINLDGLFTASIVVFNLLLITFAVILLAEINLYNLYNALVYMAIPITLYADVLIYFIFRYIFSRHKTFNLKNKKTA